MYPLKWTVRENFKDWISALIQCENFLKVADESRFFIYTTALSDQLLCLAGHSLWAFYSLLAEKSPPLSHQPAML